MEENEEGEPPTHPLLQGSEKMLHFYFGSLLSLLSSEAV